MGSGDIRRWLFAAVLAVCCAAGASSASADTAPTREQVRAAAEKVRADPNMPGVKTEKKLRFKERDDDEEEEPEKKTDSLDWLRDFVKAVAEGARWLIWGLAALALAWLVIRIRRWAQVRAGGARPGKAPLPSHVGSLDIRPESLPDDVGNAAAALWQRGQHRPALSLLYRGALSRLVHAHGVPVRAASTEGECVALSAARLRPEAQAFFARLVDAWQLAAYGGRLPSTAQVLAICGEFDLHLPATLAPQPGFAQEAVA
ncbi:MULTISPECIES: DUF4129 domain-containing protein [Variovorax]|uniref:DUF4129 domain-containing protein n=1 Tax=Variovorax TaxID=34072 RepID=UPI001F44D350|nr:MULTISPECIES: DUF4129 domain-containing protein [Variovorax]UKI07057.1 DUF4129 domain-containing protein [Variovorax paradoxus]